MPDTKKTIHTELARIQKELKAPKGQKNTFGGYFYRSCEDIVEAVKPLLGDCTLTLSDQVKYYPSNTAPQVIEFKNSKGILTQQIVGGDRYYVEATATLRLEDKTLIATGLAREADFKSGMDDAQITGSASSYARKYALNGLFAIDDTKDADATNDHGKNQDTPKTPPNRQQANTEWLGDIDDLPKTKPSSTKSQTPKQDIKDDMKKRESVDGTPVLTCSECDAAISQAIYNFSTRGKWKRPLCLTCQSKFEQ